MVLTWPIKFLIPIKIGISDSIEKNLRELCPADGEMREKSR